MFLLEPMDNEPSINHYEIDFSNPKKIEKILLRALNKYKGQKIGRVRTFPLGSDYYEENYPKYQLNKKGELILKTWTVEEEINYIETHLYCFAALYSITFGVNCLDIENPKLNDIQRYFIIAVTMITEMAHNDLTHLFSDEHYYAFYERTNELEDLDLNDKATKLLIRKSYPYLYYFLQMLPYIIYEKSNYVNQFQIASQNTNILRKLLKN